MSQTLAEFWKVAVDSKLLTPQQCQQLHADFSQIKGAVESNNAKVLAEWLVSRNVISRYQATILHAGRPGPFVYGDYRVYERIDGGRLGGWFRAVHAPTGHPVTLQFLTGAVTRDAKLWTGAAREAVAASAIVSPCLQRWHDIVDLTTFKFVVCEDLRGQTVEEAMQKGRIAPHDACRWTIAAAQGLAHLHNSGRAHGDLRPSNLWVEAIPNHPGQLKLLRDPLANSQPLNLAELDAARADYLAPEFLQPGKVPDPLTDLYALGCIFYTLLSGQPPFAGGTLEQKLQRHAAEPIRPLEQFGVPQPVAQLVTFLMAKNPAVRYQQATVVAEQLMPFVDPNLLAIPAPAPPPTLPAYDAWVQQKRTVLSAKVAPAGTVAMGGVPAGQAVATGAPAVGVAVGSVAKEPETPKVGLDFNSFEAGGKKSSDVAIKSKGVKDPAYSTDPADMKAAADKRSMKQMVIGLLATGAVLIMVLIVVNTMGGGNKPVDVVEKPEDPGTNTTTDNAANGGDSDTTNTTNVVNPGTNTPAVTPPATNNTNNPPAKPPVGPTENPGTTPTEKPTTPTKPVGFQQEVVPDDGNLLWASPTSGTPLDLRGLPNGGQVFISLRPSAMLKSSEGERVLSALGPEIDSLRTAFESGSGFKLDEIDKLALAFYNNDGKFPKICLVAHPVENLDKEAILEKLGNPTETKVEEHTMYQGKDWAFAVPFLPTGHQYFVMGDPQLVRDGLSQNTAPPLVRKEASRLLRTTDVDRHVTLLFYPNFLDNNDGLPIFVGHERAREPLIKLLGDNVLAASVSMHFDSQFYWEVRLRSSLERDPHTLAKEFRERMQKIPEQIFDYIVAMNPPEYWRKLSFKFPQMITQMHAFTRTGTEDEAAVVNGYLPGIAAHNLVLGTELAIVTTPGASSGPAVATNDKPAAKSIEDVLAMKTSYGFDNQSLEFAMRDLSGVATDLTKGAVEFPIRILGNDLQLDGITRNMSVRDFKQENKTVAEILTALVMKTSTNTDPASPEQKLIWVVAPDPDKPDKPIVLITTRKKAAERKNTLPAVFQEKKN